MSQRSDVLAARERVLKRLGLTLVIARFVPGTRIPLFIASGLFRAPLASVAAYVVATAFIYAGVIFAVFHALGAAMGEEARRTLPFVALGIVVLVMAGQFIHSALARNVVRAAQSATGGAGDGPAMRLSPAPRGAYVVRVQEDN